MKLNILLPTDFSDNSWSAIVYALKLYTNASCTFYFLNSTDNNRLEKRTHITGHFLEDLENKATKELLALKEQALEANANVNHDFEIIVSAEKLTKAIAKSVAEFAVHTIVMGTRGDSKKDNVFFGSNTVSVLKNIHSCPVLVVPDEFDFVEPKHVAFPTDYNRFYKDKELEVLRDLAELYNSSIKVVHIEEKKELSEVQQYNISKLDVYLQEVEHSFHWMPNYAKKTTVINDFIKELDINILAIVNYKHSFVENIIKEPIIKKIGYHPIIPFLVIPE
ncbi:universal stress protein [Lacinutrix sp. C3R15]|uniref:universal stress protein n=1 Tax=Flavobacteriaceae TaxID=49546 RepID=UPI001C083958|nr:MULTISPECIES: universal stress protein [Flavobacteriaceae]MBU2939768.1 universal stress protein [Lacinutrix sp. C3R15]MDO6623083.1 universal stress protein [Oceanihabitans sp. 1_MG-2023]